MPAGEPIVIETLFKKELVTLDSAGNNVTEYGVYTLDGKQRIGSSTLTSVRSTTSSTSALAASAGSLGTSNSDRSNSFSKNETHSLIEIDGQKYQFDSGNVVNNNFFGDMRGSDVPSTAPAKLRTTNAYATDYTWAQKVVGGKVTFMGTRSKWVV